MSDDLIESVARAWASIDGKAEQFDMCKNDPALEAIVGRHMGYREEAEELLERSGVASTITALRAELEDARAALRKIAGGGPEMNLHYYRYAEAALLRPETR